MYLVVWTEQNGRVKTDRWTAEETLADAKKVYKRVLENSSTWTVSICVPIKSTDYIPVDQIADHILKSKEVDSIKIVWGEESFIKEDAFLTENEEEED
tara:strand:- start:160 stop:453 length:294 start_codon:yes stop_codon:yes gene_type:complete